MGYYTPNQKLACFVLYLKIINTFLKNNIASHSKLSKELKNSITFLELLIRAIFWLFWNITLKRRSLLKFQCHIGASWTICVKGALDKYNTYLFISNSIKDFELNQHRNFQLILQMRFHFMRYFVNSIIFRVRGGGTHIWKWRVCAATTSKVGVFRWQTK